MKRRSWQIFIAVVFLAIIVGVSAWLMPPRLGLLDHATRLAVTGDENTGNVRGFRYFWLNEKEVLYVRQDVNGTFRLSRKSVFPPGNQQPEIDMNVSLPASTVPFGLSPKSLCLAYYRFNPPPPGIPKQVTPMVLFLNDGHSKIGTGDWQFEVCWTPDAKGTVTIETYPHHVVWIHNLLTQKTSKVYDLPNPVSVSQVIQNTVPVFMEDSGRIVTVENGLFFVRQTSNSPAALAFQINSQHMTFAELSLKHPQAPPHTWTVPVPQDASQGRIYVSPQHDLLLWTIYSENVSFVDTAIHKIFRKYKTHMHRLVRWQVSGLDGKQIKDIVRYELHDGNNTVPNPQWTPDGKRLSFIYNGALYTVPVD